MTDPTPGSTPISFVDNPHAPDVFVTSYSGFLNLNGVIVITFETARVDHSTTPGPVNRVVVGRLVMPIHGAQGLALGLVDFLKQQGLDPVEAITKGQTAQ